MLPASITGVLPEFHPFPPEFYCNIASITGVLPAWHPFPPEFYWKCLGVTGVLLAWHPFAPEFYRKCLGVTGVLLEFHPFPPEFYCNVASRTGVLPELPWRHQSSTGISSYRQCSTARLPAAPEFYWNFIGAASILLEGHGGNASVSAVPLPWLASAERFLRRGVTNNVVFSRS